MRATFYEDLAERLTAGALKGFAEQGVAESHVDTHDVPGAFELPHGRQSLRGIGRYAGSPASGR